MAALAVAVVGCSSAPRETTRGLTIPWEFAGVLHFRCAATLPPVSDGWTTSGVGEGDVELMAPGGRIRDDPEAERWERQMEKCLERYPIAPRTGHAPWTEARIKLQWLYYTGPLTACLAQHGIVVPQPRGLHDFRRDGFLESAYLNLTVTHDLESLAGAYRDCPPYPDVLTVPR
jgi:hypothetical protein